MTGWPLAAGLFVAFGVGVVAALWAVVLVRSRIELDEIRTRWGQWADETERRRPVRTWQEGA